MVREATKHLSDGASQNTVEKAPPTFRVGNKKPRYGIYTRTSASTEKPPAGDKKESTTDKNGKTRPEVELFSEAASWLLYQFTWFGFKNDFVLIGKHKKCYFWFTDILVGCATLSPFLFVLSSHYLCTNNCNTSKAEFRSRLINACLLFSPVVFYITFRNKWNTICKIIQIMNCLSLGLKVKDARNPIDSVRRWARNFIFYAIISLVCMLVKVIIGLVRMYGFHAMAIVALFLYSTQLIVFHYLKILVQGVLITFCVFLISKLRSYSKMKMSGVNQRQIWQEFHLICSATRKLDDLINFTLYTTMQTSIFRIPPFLQTFYQPEHFFDLDFKESIPCIIAFFINIICISVVNREIDNFSRYIWLKPKADTFSRKLVQFHYPSFKWKLAIIQERLDQIMCILCYRVKPQHVTVFGNTMEIFSVTKMIVLVTVIYFMRPHISMPH